MSSLDVNNKAVQFKAFELSEELQKSGEGRNRAAAILKTAMENLDQEAFLSASVGDLRKLTEELVSQDPERGQTATRSAAQTEAIRKMHQQQRSESNG